MVIYETVLELFRQNPALRREKDATIYLVNWPCGFGSAIQIHLSNAQYIHAINTDIQVVPLFNRNSDHFKYHDETQDNSFFSYFIAPIQPRSLSVYYAHATPILDRNEYKFRLPVGCPFNAGLAREFTWTLRSDLTEKARAFVANIRTRPLIGIHVRAIAQKQQEYARYAATATIKGRLDALKLRLDSAHTSGYSVFVATDVDYYIEGVNTVFGPDRVFWLEDVSRVAYGNTDSVPALAVKPGLKLGDDILSDCLVLGMCDATYVGPSNIPLLVWLFNPGAQIYDY